MAKLYRKYCPQEWSEAIGLEQVKAFSKASPLDGECVFFSGPSSSGKSLCAGLLAKQFTSDINIQQMNGSGIGVDDVDVIAKEFHTRPLFSPRRRAVVIEEAHNITRHAQERLLLVMETLPEYNLLLFTTTVPEGQFTDAFVSRCKVFNLPAYKPAQVRSVLTATMAAEGMDIPEADVAKIIKGARGNLRRALEDLSLAQVPFILKSAQATTKEQKPLSLFSIAQESA